MIFPAHTSAANPFRIRCNFSPVSPLKKKCRKRPLDETSAPERARRYVGGITEAGVFHRCVPMPLLQREAGADRLQYRGAGGSPSGPVGPLAAETTPRYRACKKNRLSEPFPRLFAPIYVLDPHSTQGCLIYGSNVETLGVAVRLFAAWRLPAPLTEVILDELHSLSRDVLLILSRQ